MDNIRDKKGRFTKGNSGYWLGKKRGTSPLKIKIEKELLIGLYLGNQLSTVEISKLFNCGYSVIINGLNECKIPIRNNKEATKIREFKYSEEHLNRLRTMCVGKKHSEEHRKKQSGKNHWNWKGGKTPSIKLYARKREWKEWREQIFKRDNYTCQFCEKKGYCIEPHHILPKAKYPEYVFDIDNGITLCCTCHNLTKGKEEEFTEFSLMCLNEEVIC